MQPAFARIRKAKNTALPQQKQSGDFLSVESNGQYDPTGKRILISYLIPW